MNRKNDHGYGKIPSSWNIVRLDAAADVFNGKGLGEGGTWLRVFKTKHVYDGPVRLDQAEYVPDEKADALLDEYYLKDGDILTPNMAHGTIGRVAFVEKAEPNWVCDGQVMVIRAHPNVVVPEYLYAFFSSHSGKRQLLAREVGNIFGERRGQTHLYPDDVRSIYIPIPPLEEQKAIANLLRHWESAIALAEKLITFKRHLKKGVMQKLLTGRKRFPEFKDRDWSFIDLGQLCEVRRGASPRPITNRDYFTSNGGGRGWVRISDVTASNTFLKQTKQYLSELGESKSVAVDPGDLIMSICATIGVPRIVDMKACIHDGFVVIRPKSDSFYRPFLLYFLDYLAPKLVNQGQHGTQKNLNTRIVSKILVPNLEYDEQKLIADFLLKMDEEINLYSRLVELTLIQKSGFIQKILTGDIQIPVLDDAA